MQFGGEDMYQNFNRLLREHNVTPYRVHKETGVAQSTLSDWKNGKSVPSVENLKRIAAYFGVTIDYLADVEWETDVRRENEKIKLDAFTYAMYDETRGLNEENKRRLLDLARFFAQEQKREEKKRRK